MQDWSILVVSLDTFRQDNVCRFDRSSIGTTCSGYELFVMPNETALQELVANVGPLAVAIDANRTSFMLYESGKKNWILVNLGNIGNGHLVWTTYSKT